MLDLQRRIAGWVAGATGSATFAAMVFLAPLVSSADLSTKAVATLTAGLSSVTLYKILSWGFNWLFCKIRFIRKLLLGKAFLEGTWVGHYKRDGHSRFTVETIDQREGETRISGREFDHDSNTLANWTAEAAFIDVRGESLVYVYACDVYATSHQHKGVGVFKLLMPQAQGTVDQIDGYSVDILDNPKNTNKEFRIDSEIRGDAAILAEARRLFAVT
jgi:hypothetical protein